MSCAQIVYTTGECFLARLARRSPVLISPEAHSFALLSISASLHRISDYACFPTTFTCRSTSLEPRQRVPFAPSSYGISFVSTLDFDLLHLCAAVPPGPPPPSYVPAVPSSRVPLDLRPSPVAQRSLRSCFLVPSVDPCQDPLEPSKIPKNGAARRIAWTLQSQSGMSLQQSE